MRTPDTLKCVTEQQTEPWVPSWSMGDRLRAIRRELHIKQQDFADALGVQPSTLSAWESGRNVPGNPVGLAMRIEVIWGVPAAWTLGVATDVVFDAAVDLPATAPMPKVVAAKTAPTSRVRLVGNTPGRHRA